VILRRLILLAVVIAGLAVSAGVIVVGLTYSAYALLQPHLGPAGAIGVMAAVVAVVLGGGATVMFALSRPKTTVAVAPPPPSPLAGVVATLSDAVRDRPVVVILAAVGAGVLAIRNPVYLASALRAFTAPRVAED
jgi:hypothetical protein